VLGTNTALRNVSKQPWDLAPDGSKSAKRFPCKHDTRRLHAHCKPSGDCTAIARCLIGIYKCSPSREIYHLASCDCCHFSLCCTVVCCQAPSDNSHTAERSLLPYSGGDFSAQQQLTNSILSILLPQCDGSDIFVKSEKSSENALLYNYGY